MEKEKAIVTIKRFKEVAGITLLLGLIGVGIVVSAGHNYDMVPALIRPLIPILTIVILAGYVISFIYLYKVASILKLANKIKMNPILLVLIALLSFPLFAIATIVIFIHVWNKAQVYLKDV